MRKGFTLLETILYTSLVSVLIIGVLSFLWSALESREKNQTILEVSSQGVATAAHIRRYLRSSLSVSTPARGANTDSLELAMSEPQRDPTRLWLSGGVLFVQEGNRTPVAITNNQVAVRDMVFSNRAAQNAPDSVHFEFTIASSVSSTRYQYAYQSTFYGTANLAK